MPRGASAGGVSGSTVIAETVAAAHLPARCAALLAEGVRFRALHARAGADGPEVVVLLSDGVTHRAVSCPAHAAVPTITGVVPAAEWDEREAHDVHGVRFAGHEPLRPLVAHPDELGVWTVPVTGRDVHQVAVGPIHAGVIESGHFRFHVVGERVLHLDVRLFYKHRGLERVAEGLPPERGLESMGRACAACWVSNSVAFAQACEAAEGLGVHPEVARARTVLLELERVYNHLHDLGAVCAGVGFAPGSMLFASLKERAQRLNRTLTGHRFLFGGVRLRGSDLVVDAAALEAARQELRTLHAVSARAWREMSFNGSVQDRLGEVGVLTPAEAERLGTVGPALRATGDIRDLRTSSPRLRYADFAPVRLRDPAGDVKARVEVRAAELEASFGILDALLGEGPLGAATMPRAADAQPLGVGAVESPRGETWCSVELDGGAVTRVHLRTGSYANWPSVARSAADSLIADFPLINKSFELCYACADR